MKDKNNPKQSKTPQQQPSFTWRTVMWTLLAWLIFAYFFRSLVPSPPSSEMAYSQFKALVKNGKVAEITIKGNNIQGQLTTALTGDNQGPNEPSPVQYFLTTKPDLQDPALLPLLEKNSVTIKAESQKRSWLQTLLISLLPWVLIFGLFFYASKKMQERMMGSGRGGGIFGFSRSKAKLFDKKKVRISYDDVAGLDNAKKELQEIVAYLKDPTRFQRLGGELPKGILLVGPPGVGKTLMAQATAGEADVPFYSISGSEFIEMFVGVGASRVRDMFKKAKKEAPAIIFIDELDSIGRVRGTGLGGGHDEREQTLNQILSEMDGFSRHATVIVLAATNRPDVLDPALIRPGRFDRRITVELPQKESRHEILNIHTREVPLDSDVDLEGMAERTVGMSGADLKNLVNEAALLAARNNKKQVEAQDFDRARDKILMGIEREDVLNDDEKEMVAYHEAGHALVAALLPDTDPLQKVSIIPRGRALGATEQIPEEDRHNLKRSYLLNRIAIMLGGRTAEKMVFNDVSTGAADDLKQASQLSRRMICQWGMSDALGPVSFRIEEQHPFLGRELSAPKDFSEHTAQMIDREVHQMITKLEKKAEDTLSKNRDKLNALAEQLLDRESLSKEDIDQLLSSSPN